MMRGMLALLLVLAMGLPCFATLPDERLPDPVLEGRALELTRELRCMVCQNQSIEDSDAPLARDLRLLVREKIKTGASDKEIRAFLVARYGEFVLLKPPLTRETFLLWTLPFLILLAGLGFALRDFLKRRRVL